uniref:Uncharacterized protein n=1 Tax=Timspurckia oligopyrenoides TaxID=708627 RepID=A0A7S0ZJI5_9RHOD|mmetsp:Transcript_7789/g.14146  ORF Transcript_7789/g.14146 Transcript_7789/m.14146 type:complete len:403 (+) Transcript_7789:154-1362(+)
MAAFVSAGGVPVQKSGLGTARVSSFVGVAPAVNVAKGAARKVSGVNTIRCAIQRPERYVSSDWFRNLLSLPRSVVLYRIRSHIFTNVAASAGIVAMYNAYPELPIWHVSPMPHQLLGTVMGLLLVFRTNAAYDRFWEARKLWGSLVNRTRSMSAATISYFGTNINSDPEGTMEIVLLVVSFVQSLSLHLRGQPLEDQLDELLSPAQVSAIKAANNKPLFVAQLLSLRIAKAFENRGARSGNTVAERDTLERAVADLIDIMGACERIVKTPVPLSYSRHTSRFLSIWCLTLPILLVEKEGWIVLPGMAFLSWALFSIEEVGHMIEDPFLFHKVSLPIDQYAATIRNDLLGLLDFLPLHRSENAPVPIAPAIGVSYSSANGAAKAPSASVMDPLEVDQETYSSS